MTWRSKSIGTVLALIALGCGSRETAKPPAPTRSVERLTILTYNVLADRVHLEQRLPALLEILHAADADIIAMQEADGWFLDRLANEDWYRTNYHGTMTNGYLDAPGGQCILSRFPIENWRWTSLPGIQGRTAVIVQLRINGQILAVATAHLESRLEDGAIRAAQLDAIFKTIGDDDAILLGDLNFSDGWQPETDHLDRRFVDAWTATQPANSGFTWNIERNEMAKKGSFVGETSGRIDRILVRSSRWRATSTSIVGDVPLKAGDNSLYPSDHFGVQARLEPK